MYGVDDTPSLAEPSPAVAAKALHLAGLAAYNDGRDPQAVEFLAQAIRLQPQEGDYCADLGLVLQRMGQPEAAEAAFRAAIHLNPDGASPYNNLGSLLGQTGREAEGMRLLSTAVRLQPGFAHAYNNLGCIQRAQGQAVMARANLMAARALAPRSSEIHLNLGNVLADLGLFELALESFAEAIRLRPEHFEAYNNHGSALFQLGRLDEAMTYFDRALALNPHSAETYNNCGVTLQGLGRPRAALEAYRQSLRLNPGFTDAQANLGMVLLLLGEFEEGWRWHEKRWFSRHMAVGRRQFPQPQWDGGADAGTILVHAEQGLGDTLQFCRFLPMIAPGHRVILEVQAPLLGLLQGLSGADRVITRLETASAFDAHCPLMSLPMLFGATLRTIPSQVPYLKADPDKASAWARRLDGTPGLRVGLVWAGGSRPNQPEVEMVNRRRSMSLERLAPLAEVKGLSFFSLQKGPPAEEIGQAPQGLRLHDFTDRLTDFSDTAALVENLDLVISVDTAVAHLAGALGRPVWLLNRFDSCWRWLLDRDDSPWYPTLRLFRQPAVGDWATPVAAVRAALDGFAPPSTSRRRI